MTTSLETIDKINYDNKVEIIIKANGTITGADMKVLQDAINTIIDTAKKYYEHSPIVELLEEK